MNYAAFGIDIKSSKTTGEVQTLCPQCSHDRKKKTDKCLSVNLDKQIWHCHHCGYKGGLTTIAKKEYKVPEWKNNTELPESVVKYFEGRKISQGALKKLKITYAPEWMPKYEKEIGTIQFNYFRAGELVNVKYRTADKVFKLHKDAELILYNLDGVKDFDTVYIVEGEPDVLAFITAGVENVVSVPNGANLNSNNLEYITNSFEQISHIKKWIIATDNDDAGRKLRFDLMNRLGVAKCSYLEFTECKDANEYLMKHDLNKFKDEVTKVKEFPMEGVFTVSDIYEQLGNLYQNGLDMGGTSGIPNLNLRFVRGYITTITGIPNHGKSDFLDYICLGLLRHEGWKGAFYSPENKPTELHLSKLICKVMGKSWSGDNRITPDEVANVSGWLNESIWWVKPEKDFSLESILERVKQLKDRFGLDYFVIDAWNKLEHKHGNESETKYIGESLDKLAMFCELENLHCFLVAHPTKMRKQKDSLKYEVPTLYDVSGSSNFANKSDNGITIYRNFEEHDKTTEAHITKIKFKHWGEIGMSQYNYCNISGRFFTTDFNRTERWVK